MNLCECCDTSHHDIHLTTFPCTVESPDNLIENSFAELGESSLSWFDELTEAALNKQKNVDGAPDNSTTWSPCPRGGLFSVHDEGRDYDTATSLSGNSTGPQFNRSGLAAELLGTDQLELKWTSAMATPLRTDVSSISFDTSAMDATARATPSSCDIIPKVFHRKLFSPMEEVSNADDSLSQILDTCGDGNITVELERTLHNEEACVSSSHSPRSSQENHKKGHRSASNVLNNCVPEEEIHSSAPKGLDKCVIDASGGGNKSTHEEMGVDRSSSENATTDTLDLYFLEDMSAECLEEQSTLINESVLDESLTHTATTSGVLTSRKNDGGEPPASSRDSLSQSGRLPDRSHIAAVLSAIFPSQDSPKEQKGKYEMSATHFQSQVTFDTSVVTKSGPVEGDMVMERTVRQVENKHVSHETANQKEETLMTDVDSRSREELRSVVGKHISLNKEEKTQDFGSSRKDGQNIAAANSVNYKRQEQEAAITNNNNPTSLEEKAVTADPDIANNLEEKTVTENIDHLKKQHQMILVANIDGSKHRQNSVLTKTDGSKNQDRPVIANIDSSKNQKPIVASLDGSKNQKPIIASLDGSKSQEKKLMIPDIDAYSCKEQNQDTTIVNSERFRQEESAVITDMHCSLEYTGGRSLIVSDPSSITVSGRAPMIKQSSKGTDSAKRRNRVSCKRRSTDTEMNPKKRLLLSLAELMEDVSESLNSDETVINEITSEVLSMRGGITTYGSNLEIKSVNGSIGKSVNDSIGKSVQLQSILKNLDKSKVTVKKRVRFNTDITSFRDIENTAPSFGGIEDIVPSSLGNEDTASSFHDIGNTAPSFYGFVSTASKTLENEVSEAVCKMSVLDMMTSCAVSASDCVPDPATLGCQQLSSASGACLVHVTDSSYSDISYDFGSDCPPMEGLSSPEHHGFQRRADLSSSCDADTLSSSQMEEYSKMDDVVMPHRSHTVHAGCINTFQTGSCGQICSDISSVEGQVIDQNHDGYSFDDSFDMSAFSSQVILSSQTEGHQELLDTDVVCGGSLHDGGDVVGNAQAGGVCGLEKGKGIASQETCNGAGRIENGCQGDQSTEGGYSSVGNAREDFSLDDGDDETVCAAAVQAENDESAAQQMNPNNHEKFLKRGIEQLNQSEFLGHDMEPPDQIIPLVSHICQDVTVVISTTSPACVATSLSPSLLELATSLPLPVECQSSSSAASLQISTNIQMTSAPRSIPARTLQQPQSISTTSNSLPAVKPTLASTTTSTQPLSSIFRRKQKKFLYPSAQQIKEESLIIFKDTAISVVGNVSSPLGTYPAPASSGYMMPHVQPVCAAVDLETDLPKDKLQRTTAQEKMVMSEEATCEKAWQPFHGVNTQEGPGPPRKRPRLLGFARFSDVFQAPEDDASPVPPVPQNQMCFSPAVSRGIEAGKNSNFQAVQASCSSAAAKPDGKEKMIMKATVKEVGKKGVSSYKAADSFTRMEDNDHCENTSVCVAAASLLSSAADTNLSKPRSSPETAARSCSIEDDMYMTSQIWKQTEFSQMLPETVQHEIVVVSKNVGESCITFGDKHDMGKTIWADGVHSCPVNNNSISDITSSLSHDSLQQNDQLSSSKVSLKHSVDSPVCPMQSTLLTKASSSPGDCWEDQLDNILKGMNKTLNTSGNKLNASFLGNNHQRELESSSHQQQKASVTTDHKKQNPNAAKDNEKLNVSASTDLKKLDPSAPVNEKLKVKAATDHTDLLRSEQDVRCFKLTEFDKFILQLESDVPETEDCHVSDGCRSINTHVPMKDRTGHDSGLFSGMPNNGVSDSGLVTGMPNNGISDSGLDSGMSSNVGNNSGLVDSKLNTLEENLVLMNSHFDERGTWLNPNVLMLDQGLNVKTAGFSTASGKSAGFSTASGKSPGFSKAIGKSPGFSTDIGKSPGFSTASGKSPDFSTASGKSPDFSTASGKSPGFSTASGRSISISENAMNQALKIIQKDIPTAQHEGSTDLINKEHGNSFIPLRFEGDEPCEPSPVLADESAFRNKEKNIQGFSAASRKLVHVSHSSRNKTQQMRDSRKDASTFSLSMNSLNFNCSSTVSESNLDFESPKPVLKSADIETEQIIKKDTEVCKLDKTYKGFRPFKPPRILHSVGKDNVKAGNLSGKNLRPKILCRNNLNNNMSSLDSTIKSESNSVNVQEPTGTLGAELDGKLSDEWEDSCFRDLMMMDGDKDFDDSESKVDKCLLTGSETSQDNSVHVDMTFQDKELPHRPVEDSALRTSETVRVGSIPKEQKRQIEYDFHQIQDRKEENLKHNLCQSAGKSAKDVQTQENACAGRFQGFVTAGGCRVTVSEKSLLKAKEMLNKVESQIDTAELSALKDKMPPIVNLSDRSRAEKAQYENNVEYADEMCGESDNKDHNHITHTEKMLTTSSDCSAISGFRITGHQNSVPKISGSPSTVSSGGQSVMRAESGTTDTYLDTDNNFREACLAQHDTKPSRHVLVDNECASICRNTWSPNTPSEVSTPSEAQVTVPSKSLRVSDLPKESKCFVKSCDSFGISSGFATASGLNVSTSEDALKHARSFLNESSKAVDKEVPNISFGFSTASGLKVSISEDALKHARSFLDEPVEAVGKEEAPKMSFGFSTASGTRVSVSERALQNAKTFLTDTENTHSINKMFGQSSTVFSGKQQDTKTTDCISETSTRSAKQSCGTDSIYMDNVLASAIHHSSAGDQKFSTSDTLVPQAYSKISDVHTLEGKTDLLSSGFATASDSKMYVSEVALEHVKDILNDAEISGSTVSINAATDSIIVPKHGLQHSQRSVKAPVCSGSSTVRFSLKHPGTVSIGFSTASGSAVAVSEKALKQAQFLLENINGDTLDEKSSRDVSGNLKGSPANVSQANTPVKFSTDCPFGDRSEESGSRYEELCLTLETMTEQESTMKLGDQSLASTRSGNRSARGREFHTPLRSSCEKIHFDRQKVRDRSLSSVLSGPPTLKQGNTPPLLKSQTPNTFKPPYKKVCNDVAVAGSINNGGTTSGSKVITSRSLSGFLATSSSLPSHPERHKVLPGNKAPVFVYRKQQNHLKSSHCHPELLASSEFDGELEDEEENRLLCQDFPSQNISNLDDVANVRENLKDSEKPAELSEKLNSNLSEKMDTASLSIDRYPLAGQEHMQPSRDLDLVTDSGHCHQIHSGVPLEEARMRQEKVIRNKKKERVRPLVGRWLESRQRKGVLNTFQSLSLDPKTDLTREELLSLGVASTTLEINSENARVFRFDLRRFYPVLTSDILVGDGAVMVPDEHGFAGTDEFYRAFLTLDGVDLHLVDEAWIANHYRWIVWKLAAYEVCFPHEFAGRGLTPEIVMLQLKYRYDREVDGCHRSSIKKIVERDDTPSKRLILCVASVRKMVDGQLTVELTDGWYSIMAQLDSSLTDLVARKRLGPGDKIITSGADLIGCLDGCSPLELKEGTALKLCGNSTRPAPWYSKLGYNFPPSALCVPVASLSPSGGLVSCLDVVVCRKYPVMYMERLPSGSCVFRTAEEEDKARQRYEDQRQVQVEKIFSSLQKEMEDNVRGKKSRGFKKVKKDVESLWTGQDLACALEEALNPEELQQSFSSAQMDKLMKYQQAEIDRKQQEMNRRIQEAMADSCTPRNVVPVQKFRVSGCCRSDVDGKSSCLMAVWRPGLEWMEVDEGSRYKIFNLSVTSGRSKNDTDKVMLTATRQTRLQPRPISENLLDIVYSQRKAWTVSELLTEHPPGDEFDFVGVVIQVVAPPRPLSPACVFVADQNKELMCIRLWSSTQITSLKPGQCFVASNLRLSKSTQYSRTRSVQVTADTRTDLTTFATSGHSSRYSHLFDQVLRVSKMPDLLRDLQGKIHPKTWEFSSSSDHDNQSFASKIEDSTDFPPDIVEKIFLPMSQGKPPSQITDSHSGSNTGRQITIPALWHQESVTGQCGVTTSSHKLSITPDSPSKSAVNTARHCSDVDTAKTQLVTDFSMGDTTGANGATVRPVPSGSGCPGVSSRATRGDNNEPGKDQSCEMLEDSVKNVKSSLELINKQKAIQRAKMSKLLSYESPSKLTHLPCSISPASVRQFKSPLTL